MRKVQMMSVPFRLPAMALVALLAPHVAARAQAQIPTHEGNTWGWRDHQPTAPEVQQEEKAAGIASTPSRTKSTTDTLDRLNQELLHGSGSN